MKAYKHSTAMERLLAAQRAAQTLQIAFLDLDGTWAGPPDDQQTVRDLLEASRYVICHVTSRPAEACMSWRERARSSPAIRRRPHATVDPATVAELRGLLDPDIIISSSGIEILLKQTAGGYHLDELYQRRRPRPPQAWRDTVQPLLAAATPRFTFTITDNEARDCRLKLVSESEQQTANLLAYLNHAPAATRFHFARDHQNIFITPATMSKEDAVNHVVTTLTALLQIPARQLSLLLAGDSTAEEAMGLQAGPDSPAVVIIPGGASLAGVYRVPNQSRLVVVGDQAYPGTRGPQTLIAWLQSTHDQTSL